jgi:hypothetical protein
VTGKSRPIAAGLSLITASQFTLGIYQTVLAAMHPGEPPVDCSNSPSNLTPDPAQAVIPIPFESFKFCIFSPLRKEEVTYAVMLLGYGKAFLKFI